MTTTGQLLFRFDPSAHARRRDPETSREAARSVDVQRREKAVVDALRVLGPSTSKGVAEYLRCDLAAISPRFAPLARKQLIRDSGKRGENPSGRSAVLWELALAVGIHRRQGELLNEARHHEVRADAGAR